MELTDASLLVLLGVIALALFGLLVAGLPSSRRPVVAGAVRGAQVLLLNVVVVAMAGAALNDQYLFYSSWGDLFGSRSTSVQTHQGGTVPEVVAAPVHGPGLGGAVTPGVLPGLPQPSTRLQTYTVVATRSNAKAQVYVYLPAGYDPHSTRTYPVIVGLHGFPASPSTFLRLNFLSTIDLLTSQHRMAPSIVVVPRIDTPASLDTECVNGAPGLPQTDTWLSRDLPAWVVTHLHARRDRTSWALMGYSYGAWCAASLSMRHPDVFGAAVVMQGYFRPDFTAGYDPLTTRGTEAYDLIRLARTSPPPVALWVLTAREGPLSDPSTSKFLSVAKPPLDVSATVLATGGHRDQIWMPYVGRSMVWLGQTLPGFRG